MLRSSNKRSQRSNIIEDDNDNENNSESDKFYEFDEITQSLPLSTQHPSLSKRFDYNRQYIHYIYQNKLDDFGTSFNEQFDSAIDNIIQSCEYLAEIDEFTKLEASIDQKLLDVLALKINCEEYFTKSNQILQLIDNSGDLQTLDKLWEMSGLENGNPFVRTENPSKKSKSSVSTLKKMPQKFSQYKSRIWDISNPLSPIPISYSQEPFDSWKASQKKCSSQHMFTGADEDDSDDDLIFSDARNLPTVCPISMQAFVDPVKNRACNHVYSRISIEQLISHSSQSDTGCPVAGCPHYVSRDSLIPDVEVQTKLDRIALRKLFTENSIH